MSMTSNMGSYNSFMHGLFATEIQLIITIVNNNSNNNLTLLEMCKSVVYLNINLLILSKSC